MPLRNWRLSVRRFPEFFFVFAAFALFQAGCGGSSMQQPPDTTPPTAPANLTTAVVSPAQINLSWTASTDNVGVTGYKVERCQGNACANFSQIATPASSSYNDTGLTGSTSYSYRVRATDAAGNLSAYSTTAGATTSAPTLTSPSNLVATAASSTQINLTWTASTETGGTLSGYIVQRCQGSGCSAFGTVGSPANPSFNDSGLTPSTPYSYQVRANDAVGNHSNFSAVASASTPAAGAVTISISPVRGSVTTSQTQQFAATVTGSTNTSVTWQVDGNPGGTATTGTISASGLFTPGTQPGMHTITAVSAADANATASADFAVTDLAGVFTHHNDPQRTGQNLKEYALSPSAVSSTTFGTLFSCDVSEGGAVPGYTYAQPLYMANIVMADGKVHNVVYVATESDFVYAFDADANPCQQLWNASMLDAAHGAAAGATTVPAADTGETGDLVPEIGITSTPVIDPVAKIIYVCSKTKEPGPVYVHRLHALDMTTGLEKSGSPAVISAASFDPLTHMQRPALLLNNGTVYLGFGSHGDHNVWHGWVMAYTYNGSAFAQNFVWASTDLSSDTEGAVWGAGAGPAADAGGNVWIETGNGDFDGTINYGDSVVKLSAAGSVSDFFTPSYQDTLRANDVDLGSGGVLILPDSVASTAHPHLAVATGKPGGFFLLDQNNLGKFSSIGDNDVQEVFPQSVNMSSVTSGVFGVATYWNGNLYISVIGDNLRQYTIANGGISAVSASSSANAFGYPSAIPSVSANGASGGIVWATDTSGYSGFPVILYAYDATNLSNQLFASPGSGAGAAGNAVKFNVPTVANGKVYVAGQGQLTVFGLLPN